MHKDLESTLVYCFGIAQVSDQDLVASDTQTEMPQRQKMFLGHP